MHGCILAIIDVQRVCCVKGSSALPDLPLKIFPRTDRKGASFYIGWTVRMITVPLPEREVSGQSGAIG
ncbi:hypothetical protein [Paenibacillus lautus]|nr:hypothetical protein [Paenibacillus lautus]MCI1776745.1 hypothetical protein [Paenibacillus lautus]VTR23672.1 Uncharacterised protein [Actinobacillus pleuropneumoniae]